MDPQQQFCLKWNSFGNNLVNTFDNLYQSSSLTDVTLFCEGHTFQAHKLILAACSKHFQDLFESAPLSPSILVILDGTSSRNMSALLEFMYKGEVHVAQESLSSFLKAAEYLQVKGLSIEHEKLVTQPASNVDSRVDSPSSRNSKMSNKMEDTMNTNSTTLTQDSENMRPPASTTPSFSSAYSMSHYKPSPYDQRGLTSPHPLPSVCDSFPRKRIPRSPSDQVRDKLRPSVLRDPSSMVYDPSPISVPSLTSDMSVNPFKQTAAVPDNSPSPQSWHSNTNDAEDLRIKNEPTESGGSNNVDENGTKYYSIHGMETNQRDRDIGDRIPSLPHLIPSGPSGLSSTWKLDPSHRGVPTTTTTPDGKKLQCPYCERLYGYETNLRAHIRQRHQGIRVPCPFCTRTFTRNNTVRRHIAREHKTEIGLKPLPHTQVQNHSNQQQ